MNRRLHHPFLALFASALTLALCLPMALPAPQQPQASAITLNADPVKFTFTPSDSTASLADAAALTATAATLAEAIKRSKPFDTATIDTESKQARSANRQRRQALVMPYFSFAPRG